MSTDYRDRVGRHRLDPPAREPARVDWPAGLVILVMAAWSVWAVLDGR